VLFDVTSLATSQLANVLWLKDKMTSAAARPRVAARLASDTNLRKRLMSLMAISLSLVSPMPRAGKRQ